MAFFRNTALTVASNFGTSAIGLLTSVLLARTLGPFGRGLMTPILIWPTILAWAGSLSLGFGITYYGAAEPEKRRALFANSFWMALLLGGLTAVPSALLLPRFVQLNTQQYALLMISLACLPVWVWSDFALSLLRGANAFKDLSVIRLAGPIVTACLLFVLWIAHRLTVLTAIEATWAGMGMQAAISWMLIAKAGYVGFRPDGTLLRHTLTYALHSHPGTLAKLANGRLDQLLMTAIVAPTMLGLYGFAVTFSELLQQVTTAISVVVMPRVASEGDEEAQRAFSVRAARWTLLTASVLALVLFFVAPLLVRLLWGSRFLGSVPAIRILLPGIVAIGVASTMGSSLRGVGKPLTATYAEFCSLGVMTALLLTLLPRLGIYGAALAVSCGYGVNCLVTAWFFANHFGAASLFALRPTLRDWQEIGSIVRRLQSRRGLT